MAIDTAAIDKIKEENPDAELLLIESSMGDVIAKIPTANEMNAFRSKIFDEKRRANATESLVRSCVLYPDREELNVLIQKRPLIIEKVAAELDKAGGGQEELTVKKL